MCLPPCCRLARVPPIALPHWLHWSSCFSPGYSRAAWACHADVSILEHMGLESSHLSYLDYRFYLLYTGTKTETLERDSDSQNADGIKLGYRTEAKISKFFRTRRLMTICTARPSKSWGLKIVLTLAKASPQALCNCHAQIRNLKSEGLLSVI